MARCARCDVRRGAAVFVGSDETTALVNQLCSRPFRRLLLQIGGANIVARIAPWNARSGVGYCLACYFWAASRIIAWSDSGVSIAISTSLPLINIVGV